MRFVELHQHRFHSGVPVTFQQTAGQLWFFLDDGFENLRVVADRAAHESRIAHANALVPADDLLELGQEILQTCVRARSEQGLVPA